MKKSNSFAHRLTVLCLTFTLVPILLFFSVYSVISSKVLQKNLDKEFSNITTMLMTQLDELYSNMSFISLELLNRSDFFGSIKQLYYNSDNKQRVQANYSSVVNSMNNYGYFQKTYTVIYLDKNGYYFNTDLSMIQEVRLRQVPPKELATYDWCTKAIEANGSPVMIQMPNNALVQSDAETLSIVRSIVAPTSVIGYIIVQLNVSERAYIFGALDSKGGMAGVFSDTGVQLYAHKAFPQELSGEAVQQMKPGVNDYRDENGVRYSAFVSEGETSDIRVVTLFPSAIFSQELLVTLLPNVIIVLLLLVLTIAGILVFSRSFSKPLVGLSKMMRETTIDNLEQPQTLDLSNASDEIKYLHVAYEKMRDRLHAMIHERVELLDLQAEQRYRFLQYQINPHFMYNTLNVIGIMGVQQGSMQIHQSCQMLAKLLRYSLEDYRKGTTFKEEMDNIHTYLTLMKFRFEHRVVFSVDYDVELDSYAIPRFTLQPFVENIFEHAYDAQHKVVAVRIRACVDADRWRISIADNGQGILQKDVVRLSETIQRFFDSEYDQPLLNDIYGGIGVKNTVARLHVFFGGDFSFEIGNNETGGCTITLCGALKEGENA